MWCFRSKVPLWTFTNQSRKNSLTIFLFFSFGKPEKSYFFSGPEGRGGGKGRAIKKKELFLKLEKKSEKNVAWPLKKLLLFGFPHIIQNRGYIICVIKTYFHIKYVHVWCALSLSFTVARQLKLYPPPRRTYWPQIFFLNDNICIIECFKEIKKQNYLEWNRRQHRRATNLDTCNRIQVKIGRIRIRPNKCQSIVFLSWYSKIVEIFLPIITLFDTNWNWVCWLTRCSFCFKEKSDLWTHALDINKYLNLTIGNHSIRAHLFLSFYPI